MVVQAGRWELLSDPMDRAWDDLLKAAGVSEDRREAGQMVKPQEWLTRAGDQWTLTILSELKNEEVTFAFGQRVIGSLAVLVPATSVFTEEQNRLIQTFTINGKTGSVVREQFPEEMIATYTYGGVTAIRKYKRT